jgi:integrase
MTQTTDMASLISGYLAATGMSCAALSRKSKVGEGIVAKILREPAYAPPTKIIAALSETIGIELPSPFERSETWAQITERLIAVDHKDPRISRIKWLLRNTGWVGVSKTASRKEVVKFFSSHVPATFDLSPASYASYKSNILSCLPPKVGRKRGIRDLTGPLRQLYDALGQDEASKDYHLLSGSFFAWMDEHKLSPCELNADALVTYYGYRCAEESKTEKATRIHVQRVASLTRYLAAHPDYKHYGFPALPSPWARSTEYSEQSGLPALLAEFDEKVAPWLMGEISTKGKSRKQFLAELDSAAMASRPGDDKVAALARARARSRKTLDQGVDVGAKLVSEGFLRTKDRWSKDTVHSFRKTIRSMAWRLFLKEEIAISTISELVDPQMVELMLLLNAEANPDEKGLGSTYATTFAQRVFKIARGYVVVKKEDLETLNDLKSQYDPKRTSMAPRNQAKIELFTDTRINRFLDLSPQLLKDIKLEIAERRRWAKAREEVVRTVDLYDSDLACRVMQVIAHDLLLARAPRSSNVIYAKLEWIRWRGNCATLVIPAAEVKMRSNSDVDLIIPLSQEASETLRAYLGFIRAKALRQGDEANLFLFPSPKKSGEPYISLLNALCRRVHTYVGTPLNPHLYRHLIGWIWLRKDPAALPQVQRLLGHKSIETTMRYYADIADDVAINLWQEFIKQAKT